jgi:hypothetical protein
VNSTVRRVGRLEQAAGVAEGPCPLCERRASSDVGRAARGPEFVERAGPDFTLPCPRCDRPVTFKVVYVSRRAAA